MVKEKLKQYQLEINDRLQGVMNEEGYDVTLKKAASYALLTGGKRLRPILMLATYEMFHEKGEEIFPYMIAMEMIHQFSLVHDDLPAIDNDFYRHGQKSCHAAFGESCAILAGDTLLNDAYLFVLQAMLKHKTITTKQIQALWTMSKATEDMISGEFVDIIWEKETITTKQLEYLHQHKTGALIIASVQVGGILGDCSKEEFQALTKYAQYLGLAYQIQDDILNVIGDSQVMGKPVHTDAIMGKVTYVTQFGLSKAQEMLEDTFREAMKPLAVFQERADFLKEVTYNIIKREK